MKVLFAHNCLTAYKPLDFKSKVFNFMAKCQSKLPLDLFEQGVRGFDIRVKCDEDGFAIASHGYSKYKVDVEDLIRDLSKATKNGKGLYIRLIHEDALGKSNLTGFHKFAQKMINRFTGIKWKIYDSKKNWTLWYNTFPDEEEVEYLWHKGDGLYTPKSYANKYNHLNLDMVYDLKKGFYYFDFL